MAYKAITTSIPDVLILEPEVFADARGFFFESFNLIDFERVTGLKRNFVQDNHSKSCLGVLRGLHYQNSAPQGKLIRAVIGEIYDVAVDLRPGSPYFGKWVGEYLSADNKRQFWVPEGFAHGFLVVSDFAEVLYKATNYYKPGDERCLIWSDTEVGIPWPLKTDPILSAKDINGIQLKDLDLETGLNQ